MALPALTDEQRAAALEAAKVSRQKRAELKEGLKTGAVTLAEVLDSDDKVVVKTRIEQVIKSLPGVGKVRAEETMEEIGIKTNRTVSGLGERQKRELLEKFGG